MKLLTLFLLLPLSLLGQGVSVRSLNGLATNLHVRGLNVTNVTPSRPAYLNANGTVTNASGTPDGTKFLRDDGVLAVPSGGGITNVSQTAVGSGSYLTYTMTDNGFISGWGGNQPTFIFRDGGAGKYEYAAIGWDDVSNAGGLAGQFSLRGDAAEAYGNIAGIHFNDTTKSGDNRLSVIRVKDPAGGAGTELGGYVWWGVRYDENAPDALDGPDAGSVYSSPVVLDQHGNAYLGFNVTTSDDPASIPAWITRHRLGKVVISGSAVGSYPSLVITNDSGGTNHGFVFHVANPARQTVMNAAGQVAIGTNNTTVQLHVVRDLATNVMARFDDTNYTRRVQLSTLVGTPAYGAFYLGDVTPTANNFVLTANGTSDTFLNAPSGGNINLGVNGASEVRISSTATIPVADLGNSLGTGANRWSEVIAASSSITATQSVGTLSLTNGLHGSMRGTNNYTIGVTTGGVSLTNYVAQDFNGWTGSPVGGTGGFMTNTHAGRYLISAGLSGWDPATLNAIFNVCILTNGTRVGSLEMEMNDAGLQHYMSTSLSVPLYLPAGTQISLGVAVDAAQDFNIRSQYITATRISTQ